MKKQLTLSFAFFLALLLCALPLDAAFQPLETASQPLVVDGADLLTEAEEEALGRILEEIAQQYVCDVIVVTTDSLEGYSARTYADTFFDQNGYGRGAAYTGILFLVSMTEREWAFSTCGDAISAFTADGLDLLEEKTIPYLSSGDYGTAFSEFADTCRWILAEAEDGEPYGEGYGGYDIYDGYDGYDSYDGTASPLSAGWIIGSVIGGFVLSLIVVSIMARDMKSVRYQKGADSYEKEGSFILTRQQDLFLYHQVTRIRHQTQKSGGRSSSSGRSHGGRSGRF